jgi:hypothetical protein
LSTPLRRFFVLSILAACGRDGLERESPSERLKIVRVEACDGRYSFAEADAVFFDTLIEGLPALDFVVHNFAPSPVTLVRFDAAVECALCSFGEDDIHCRFAEYAHLCGSRLRAASVDTSPIPSGGSATVRAPVMSEELIRAADAVLAESEDLPPPLAISFRVHVSLEAASGDGSIVRSDEHDYSVGLCRGCKDDCEQVSEL